MFISSQFGKLKTLQSGVLPVLIVLSGLTAGPLAVQAQNHPILHVPPTGQPHQVQHIPAGPQMTGHPHMVQPAAMQPQIQQVQSSDDDSVERPLPHQILNMPKVQQDLEVIQRRSQLIVTRSGIVRTAIADPTVIDVVQYSPTEISIIGIQRGATTLTLWFENSPEPLIYLVKVIRDPSLDDQRRIDYGKLERKLVVLFPNSKVYLIPLSSKIIVKGQARDAEEAARILQVVRGEFINEDGNLGGPQPVGDRGTGNGGRFGNGVDDLASSFIVNMLEVPGDRQVMLRVRIAELNRSHLRRMGVDFDYLINSGRHAVSAAVGGAAANLTGIFENGEISILLDWLAGNGTAKILSEPVLTVLSGHPASFLSGGEFAVPTIIGVDGAQGTSTTFRGFGTSVIVTPTVIDKDLIRMRIAPEFSAVNSGNSVGGVPGLDSRRVQTTVQLREGQTIAIAGLLSRQTNTEINRIPFLGELPWIGPRIFNAKRSTEDETELLILVSPEIVRPMDADEVPPVPGWYVTHPNNFELYKYAMSEGSPDLEHYQLAPYGRGNGHGIPVGYSVYNPAPASPGIAPVPTGTHMGSTLHSPIPSNVHVPPPPSPQPQYPAPSYGTPLPGTSAPLQHGIQPIPAGQPMAQPMSGPISQTGGSKFRFPFSGQSQQTENILPAQYQQQHPVTGHRFPATRNGYRQ